LSAGRVIFLAAALWRAAAQHCDPQLVSAVSPNDPNRYRLREDRCEGLYHRGVSGETLLEASLTEVYEDFRAASASSLLLEWKAPAPPAATFVRAYSLRPRVLYRMDTERPPGAAAYTWPLGVAKALNLTRNDIGLVAWVRQRIGGVERQVYLPLRARAGAGSAAPRKLRLIVIPGIDATELYLTLAAAGPDGRAVRYLLKNEALQQGAYTGGWPVPIDLPELKHPGLYLARVAAVFVNNAPGSPRDIWFYYTP
jgi:hypothetical protein